MDRYCIKHCVLVWLPITLRAGGKDSSWAYMNIRGNLHRIAREKREGGKRGVEGGDRKYREEDRVSKYTEFLEFASPLKFPFYFYVSNNRYI